MQIRIVAALVLFTLVSVPVFAQKHKRPSAADFAALIDQVNVLQGQVTSLQDQINEQQAALAAEGETNRIQQIALNGVESQAFNLSQQVAALDPNHVRVEDIVGTYRLVSVWTNVGVNTSAQANIATGRDFGLITFNADGTGTMSRDGMNTSTLLQGLPGAPWGLAHGGTPSTNTFNWTLSGDGATLNGLFGQATVTIGGQLLLWNNGFQITNTGSYSLILAARLPQMQE
jgi:hypothetical protein